MSRARTESSSSAQESKWIGSILAEDVLDESGDPDEVPVRPIAHRGDGGDRKDPVARSTSAPPQLSSQLESLGESAVDENDPRLSPEYFAYYYAQRPLDPRLPPPLFNWSSWRYATQGRKSVDGDLELFKGPASDLMAAAVAAAAEPKASSELPASGAGLEAFSSQRLSPRLVDDDSRSFPGREELIKLATSVSSNRSPSGSDRASGIRASAGSAGSNGSNPELHQRLSSLSLSSPPGRDDPRWISAMSKAAAAVASSSAERDKPESLPSSYPSRNSSGGISPPRAGPESSSVFGVRQVPAGGAAQAQAAVPTGAPYYRGAAPSPLLAVMGYGPMAHRASGSLESESHASGVPIGPSSGAPGSSPTGSSSSVKKPAGSVSRPVSNGMSGGYWEQQSGYIQRDSRDKDRRSSGGMGSNGSNGRSNGGRSMRTVRSPPNNKQRSRGGSSSSGSGNGSSSSSSSSSPASAGSGPAFDRFPPYLPSPGVGAVPSAGAVPRARGGAGAGSRPAWLDEFRVNKNTANLSLRNVVARGMLLDLATDQNGSRFIQVKLESATPDEKQAAFEQLLPETLTLCTDVFGNYVIQKFFEHGSLEQKKLLAGNLVGNVKPLSLQMYGCRVVQKAIETLDVETQGHLVRELQGHVMECVKDQNGNHVIQKCIEKVPSYLIHFIVEAFTHQVFALSTHPYGCRVIQRLLEHCSEQQRGAILDEVLENVEELCKNQYGNYVIQHVLTQGSPWHKYCRTAIVRALRGKIFPLSKHKFASNVVEKCFAQGSDEERQILIEEVLGKGRDDPAGKSPLILMVKDQYANYVVQKILDVAMEEQRSIIVARIKRHIPNLRKLPYGKHIIARVEKLSLPRGGAAAAAGGGGGGGGGGGDDLSPVGGGSPLDSGAEYPQPTPLSAHIPSIASIASISSPGPALYSL